MINCRRSLASKHSPDKLAFGALKAEPSSMVVSAFEEEQQERNKPDPIRQYGLSLSLDAKLTITTKKGLVSTEPVDEKSLRDKYACANEATWAQYLSRFRSIHVHGFP